MKRSVFLIIMVALLALLVGCKTATTNPTTAPETSVASTTAPVETTAASTEPATAEKITISIAIRTFPQQAPDPSELWQWKKYEEISNVHVDWVGIPSDQIAEKKGVMMASNDYPDAFYGYFGFSSDDVVKYGTQGIFIKLNDLLDSSGPSLTKMFSEHPDWKASLVAPDGNIYSLPWIDQSILPSSLRYYINQKWLDKLGLKVPETLDEFTEALRKFKTEDANGNGDPNDEIPFELPNGGGFVGLWENCLVGSFGMGNGGLQAIQQMLYIDKNNEIQTTVNDAKMKDIWKYMKMYIQEGLMPDTTFSGIDYAKWVADGKDDKIGAFAFVHPYYLSSDATIANNYAGINVLTGSNGDRVMSYVDYPIRGNAVFEITNKNKYPEQTMRWIDYSYGDAGRYFFKLGLEGETYTMVNGQPQFIKEIREKETGDGLGVFQWIFNWYGGYVPTWELDNDLVYKALVNDGEEFHNIFNTTAEDAEKWKPSTILPRLIPTADESTRTSAILTDVSKYVSEARAKFVLGEWNLDGADWDTYVANLNKMGLSEYLTIMRNEYKRYDALLK